MDGAAHPVSGASIGCEILAYAAARGTPGDASTETQSGQMAARKLVRHESRQITTLTDGTGALVLGSDYENANLDIEINALLANGRTVQAKVRVRTTA